MMYNNALRSIFYLTSALAFGDATTKIAGYVKTRFPETPAVASFVKCFDADTITSDDKIGEAVTGADGQFVIETDTTAWDMFGHKADLYCVVDGPGLVMPSRTETKTVEFKDGGILFIGVIYIYPRRSVSGCRVNGCGPLTKNHNWDKAVPDFSFTDACNQHDCCYDVCASEGLNKERCDFEIYELMLNSCRLKGSLSFPGCKGIATSYYIGLTHFGERQHWCNKQCKGGCDLAPSNCTCDSGVEFGGAETTTIVQQ